MSGPHLPAELPWQQGQLLSWPETVLAGGKRWERFVDFTRADAQSDAPLLTIRSPFKGTIYRGHSEACGDARARIDIAAALSRGDIARPCPPIGQ